ncbi:hypothetical protein G6F56_001394 [Rhizopus delemar]|uniref:Uncharacterized protein n=1 Tax=Rhizopus stolonifer TaxID=4846 RepID=A0A367KM88_RHIST|nr:hypothetical protein G6F56_001394 [Rhizopus delemar]RCI03345.1 hypothetical protein CU098_011421 [Rhizopus stolonifer]
MPDFCRYCKALGHSKNSCDKRPADSRTCYVCHQKDHISYQYTRTQNREPQLHKRPRNCEPTSIITSHRIATLKSTKGSKASTKFDLTFGPSSWSSALATSSSDVVSQISTANPPDDLSQTAVKEILIQNSLRAEPAIASALGSNLDHSLISSSITASADTSVSKLDTHPSTSAPSDHYTKSTDAEMTDL